MGVEASATPPLFAYGCATGITSRLSKWYMEQQQKPAGRFALTARQKFFGSEIRSATAKDGQRYADLFGSVQSFSHILLGLSGAQHWLKR